MPNKKPQINPFSMYMREQEPLLRRRGIEFNSKKDLVEYLHPHFKALPELERNKYKNMAKIEKDAAKNDLTQKFDDRGVPLSQIAAQKQEEEQKIKDMMTGVHRLVHQRGGDDTPLLTTKFYTMSISLRCFTERGKESEYIPCEISICEWTIADGVGRSCSYIVEPDRIPMGYQSQCLEIAEKTHRIPLRFAEAESNLPGIWIRLINFLNPQQELAQTPPVFTPASEVEQTEAALQWLYNRSMDRRANPFRVYRLDTLLLELYIAAGEPQTQVHCMDKVKKGYFEYFTELACQYHAEDDNSKFCTLAMVRRHAMLIMDCVVPGFGVKVKAGKHVPHSKSEVCGVVVNAPLARGVERPIPFKPTRETEPNLPSQFSLIKSGKSSFRGGDRDAPVSADSSWTACAPWSSGDQQWAPPAPVHPRKPTSRGRSGAPAPSIVPCASSWGSVASEAAPSVTSETDFPSLGGLAGRSRPLTTQPRAPGARPSAVPHIGRGRQTVAERFAAWPGLREGGNKPGQ